MMDESEVQNGSEIEDGAAVEYHDYSTEVTPSEPEDTAVLTPRRIRRRHDAEAAAADPVMVTVRLLNTDIYDGRYLVAEAGTNNAYLIPIESARWTVKDQEIPAHVLQTADRPYNFDHEIDAMSFTPDEIRMALWKSGLATEDRLRGVSMKEILSRLVSKGILSVKEQGNG